MKERRLEIIGILIIIISLLVLASLIGFNPSEEVGGIPPNLPTENPMGIVGVLLLVFSLKRPLVFLVFFFQFLELSGDCGFSGGRNLNLSTELQDIPLGLHSSFQ